MSTSVDLDALREQFVSENSGYSFRHVSCNIIFPINRNGNGEIQLWERYIMKKIDQIVSVYREYHTSIMDEVNKCLYIDYKDKSIKFPIDPPSYPCYNNQIEELSKMYDTQNYYNTICAWEKHNRSKLDEHIAMCREKNRIRKEEHEKRKADALKEVEDYKKNMVSSFRRIFDEFSVNCGEVVSVFGEATDTEIYSIIGEMMLGSSNRYKHHFTRDILLYYKTINKFARLHDIRVEDAEKVMREYYNSCIKECE